MLEFMFHFVGRDNTSRVPRLWSTRGGARGVIMSPTAQVSLQNTHLPYQVDVCARMAPVVNAEVSVLKTQIFNPG